MSKVIFFSIPAHECPYCLRRQVDIIKSKVPRALVVVSLSRSNDFHLKRDLIDGLDNVLVNPESRVTYWGDIVYPHISNYKFVKGLGIEWDYWAFEASNSTIVRDGLDRHIANYHALVRGGRDDGIRPNQTSFKGRLGPFWWDHKFNRDERFMRMVRAESFQVFNGFVEGMVFERRLMDEIAGLLILYGCDDHRDRGPNTYPREEVYFQTVFFNKYEGVCDYTHTYCDVGIGNDLDQMEFHFKSFPGGYAIKPTPRRQDDPLRVAHEQIVKLGLQGFFERRRVYAPDQSRVLFKEQNLKGGAFIFGNGHGELGKVVLCEDGSLGGYSHFNERHWRVDSSGDLMFLNGDRYATTIFHSEKGGIFFGDMPRMRNWHWLRPVNAPTP